MNNTKDRTGANYVPFCRTGRAGVAVPERGASCWNECAPSEIPAFWEEFCLRVPEDRWWKGKFQVQNNYGRFDALFLGLRLIVTLKRESLSCNSVAILEEFFKRSILSIDKQVCK